jgi:hypothetical protein
MEWRLAMTSSIIQPQVNCATAREFIEALSPIGPYFKDAARSDEWLFRGQGKDRPLIPSVFRKDGDGNYLWHSSLHVGRDLTDFGQFLLAERDTVVRFFQIADRRGLVLPDDSQELRSRLETAMSKRGDDMVSAHAQSSWEYTDHAVLDQASLVALAQHYGIPTRLLDWTRLPYVAAFFAAESAFKRMKYASTDDQLVVWSFLFPLLSKFDPEAQYNAPIRVITAPSATNSNLKAQQGVFTLVKLHDALEDGTYLPLDKILEKYAEQNDTELEGYQLRKFMLPVSQADELLQLLAKLGIMPSVIYPGYQSIIDDLRMEDRWSGSK